MKKYRIVFVISCLVLLISLIPISSSCTAQAPAGQTFKIGVITSITGPMSAAFKGLYDAIEPIKEFYNTKKGGITVGGQKYMLDLVAEDDQSSPAGAVAAINKIAQAGIKYVVNPVFPPAIIALVPISTENKIMTFSCSQLDPTQFTSQNPYNFNCNATMYNIYSAYDYLKKTYPSAKKIAFLSPDDPGPNYVLGLLDKELPARGYEIVARDKYGMDIQDFYPVVNKILAGKPDVIECVGGMPLWAAGIANAAREQGFNGVLMCGCTYGDMNVIKSLLKPGFAHDIFQMTIDPLSNKIPQDVQDLAKLTATKTGQPYNFDNFQIIGALYPMLAGITKAGSFDVDKVLPALEGMQFDQAYGGKGKWTGQDLGFLHLGIIDKVAITMFDKNGNVQMDYIPNPKW